MKRLALVALLFSAAPAHAQSRIVIRTNHAISRGADLRGRMNIVVLASRIQRIDGGDSGDSVTYDLSRYTVLPGLIDTHVHIDSHFGKDGRASNTGEATEQRMLYSAENAFVTLMAGFTTVQSIGSSSDVPL